MLAAEEEDPDEIDLFATADDPEPETDTEHGFADTGSERLAEIPEDDDALEVIPDEPPDEIPAPDLGLTPMGKKRSAVTESDEIDYRLPPVKLLEKGKASDQGPDTADRESTSKNLLEALGHVGVDAKLVGVVSGPHVSRYELQLAPGTKVGKVSQLKDDLAYALASTDIRILAPIPGKRAVGVEVPNARRRLVRLGDIYKGRPKGSSPLVGWLGKDVSGQSIACDIAMMPHLLVAGTTGSGGSGCVNAILTSILMSSSPNEVRMVLVDPKQVELNHYDAIPHLLTPVVTSPRMAANVLANLIGEMESRYGIMGQARARNLVELNRIRKRKGEAPLPHILCIHRRARRPDDGRAGGSRGRDHPARAEVSRGRHPPDPRHAAALHGHHHGHDQGQHPGPDRLRRRLAGRLARHPRRGRRREPPRPGRHALPRRGYLEDGPYPGRLRDRGRDRARHQALVPAGRARFRPGAPRGEGRALGRGHRRRVLPG